MPSVPLVVILVKSAPFSGVSYQSFAKEINFFRVWLSNKLMPTFKLMLSCILILEKSQCFVSSIFGEYQVHIDQCIELGKIWANEKWQRVEKLV